MYLHIFDSDTVRPRLSRLLVSSNNVGSARYPKV